MARKPMVTRTIKSTKVTALCLDVVQEEPYNETVILPRTYKNDKDLMKAVSEAIDTNEIKAVHIVSTEIETNLYGMTEADFIKYAKVMPDRKTNETDNTTETDTESERED